MKELMQWIPVNGHDTDETVVAIGFECSKCGYVAYKRWLKCPHCDRKWNPAGEIYMNAPEPKN